LHHCKAAQCAQLSVLGNDEIVPQNNIMNARSMNDLINYCNNEANVNDYTGDDLSVSKHNKMINMIVVLMILMMVWIESLLFQMPPTNIQITILYTILMKSD